ncbi:hypothetical protein [Iodobacter sp.]|uniref:hypothetical protein n=1 Tax=Iodobacter sp. TaxID=1915058 RepID=UPI0025FE322D|nr:hypothetical protein [Iodobacter sp.]
MKQPKIETPPPPSPAVNEILTAPPKPPKTNKAADQGGDASRKGKSGLKIKKQTGNAAAASTGANV